MRRFQIGYGYAFLLAVAVFVGGVVAGLELARGGIVTIPSRSLMVERIVSQICGSSAERATEEKQGVIPPSRLRHMPSKNDI